jgi:putative tryptophan/tyrosine transport system substrate-binding protein
MTVTIGRREMVAALGGAAVAWPLAARAQQSAMPVIGFLNSTSPGPYAHLVAAFRKGLSETGYVEGRNVAIEYRWAEGQCDRLPALAADLVRRQVAVIAACGGEPSVLAAKAATSTIPILFITGSDPVKLGIVASLNRPGGNVTGVSIFYAVLGPKRLALLQELVPKMALIGVVANPTFAYTEEETKDVLAAGHALDKQVHIATASTEGEIDAAFKSLVERRVDALMVGVDPFFVSRRGRFIALAAHHAVPVMYFSRDFTADGGLISYGPNLSCTRGWMDNGEPRCIAFGGLRVDDAIEGALLTVVGPGAIAAAVAAEKEAGQQRDQVREALRRDLEAARYAADRAFRQYDAADPANRLVTGELEARWNKALARVAEVEAEIAAHDAAMVPGHRRSGIVRHARSRSQERLDRPHDRCTAEEAHRPHRGAT